MRVAQLTPYFPPHIGGVEFHVKELSEELAARGHDVEVFTTDVPGGTCDATIPVTRLSAIPVPYAPLVPRLSTRLRDLVDGFDVVHSHLPPPFFTAAAPDTAPHVATYHCDIEIPDTLGGLPVPDTARDLAEDLYDRRYGPDITSLDRVIATTESYATTSPIIRDLDCAVVPNGVRPDEFRFTLDKDPVLLFVGRLASSKGVDDLLDAAPRILADTPIEEIRIVGEGEEERNLKKRARALGLDGVTFTGSVPFRKLKQYLAEAACLVLPSTSRLEAFGIVQLEAFASGTPVVASDIPGVREVGIPGETGALFRPGEPDDLAEAVADVLSGDVEEMGRRARNLVEEKYTWGAVADGVEEIYEELI